MSSVILAIIQVVEVVIRGCLVKAWWLLGDSKEVRWWFDGGSTEVLCSSYVPLTMLPHVVGISSVYLRYDFGVLLVYD